MTATGQLTASTIMMAPLALLIDHSWGLAHAQPRGVGGHFGAGAAVNGVRLSPLLSHPGHLQGLQTCLLVTFLIPVSAVLAGHIVPG